MTARNETRQEQVERERHEYPMLQRTHDAQRAFKGAFAIYKEAERMRLSEVRLADRMGISRAAIARQLGVSPVRVKQMCDPEYRRKSRRGGSSRAKSNGQAEPRADKKAKAEGPDRDPRSQQRRVASLSRFGKTAYTIGTHPDQNTKTDVRRLLEAIDGYLRNR